MTGNVESGEPLLVRMHPLLTSFLGTLFCIAVSVGVTYAVMAGYGKRVGPENIVIATVAPAVLAGPMIFGLSLTIRRLDALRRELRRFARVDSMTGALMRRSFVDETRALLNLCLRNRSDFSILYIDLDHFKEVNDTYGHTGGDAALERFGSLIRTMIRKSDLFGRIGGEEFAVALPHTNAVGAASLAERCRKAIEEAEVEFSGKRIGLTFSGGIASLEADAETELEVLMNRADRALYRAKAEGRNRIVIDGKSVPARFSPQADPAPEQSSGK